MSSASPDARPGVENRDEGWSSRPGDGRASREIAPLPRPTSPSLPEVEMPRVDGVDLYGALLADSRCENTLRSRVDAVRSFCAYVGVVDPSRAVAFLFSGTAGQANAVALGYRKHLIDEGKSSATINLRLATLRRAAKLARRLGLVPWNLEVDCLPREAYRDTSGPGDDGWRKILAVAEGRAAEGMCAGFRDLAMIRLMHDNGLRKAEMIALDMPDVDVPGRRVAVLGKGKRQKSWLTMNGPTTRALAAWLEVRGPDPGAVFVRVNRGSLLRFTMPTGPSRLSRLLDRAVNRIVGALGEAAGVERGCRPHGLRHAGATRLLDLTNGDIRAVQKWTRHVNVNTVLRYDDNRLDMAGDLARRLGEGE